MRLQKGAANQVIMVRGNINLKTAGQAFKGTTTDIDLSKANDRESLREAIFAGMEREKLVVTENSKQPLKCSINAPLYVVLNVLKKCGCQVDETKIGNDNWKVWTLHK